MIGLISESAEVSMVFQCEACERDPSGTEGRPSPKHGLRSQIAHFAGSLVFHESPASLGGFSALFNGWQSTLVRSTCGRAQLLMIATLISFDVGF